MPRTGNQLGRNVPGTTYACAPGGPNDYVYHLRAAADVAGGGRTCWASRSWPTIRASRPRRRAGRTATALERHRRGVDAPAQQARGDAPDGRRRACPAAPARTPARCWPTRICKAREMIVDVDYPTRGTYQTVGCPIKLSDSPVAVTPPAAARRAHGRSAGLAVRRRPRRGEAPARQGRRLTTSSRPRRACEACAWERRAAVGE